MDRRKKKSIFLIIIFVLVIMLAAIFGSYALWQKVKKQKNKNVVGTACLNVTFSNESGNISFDNAYPVTDAEGASGTPYTFTLTNECDEEVNYVIGLESIENGGIESSEYLDSSYIKVKLDDDNANNYSNYGAISDDAMADYNIRETKGLNHHTLAPHETATHEIRMWIDENTPIQNEDHSYNTDKYFFGKIRIIAGQNIEGDAPEVATDSSCFSFDSETGSITGYTVGENCPTDVVIPSKINSVKVKTIGNNAFANSGLTSVIIPESVTEIEENAFMGNQLTSVTISKKVTSIGSNAFANNVFASEDSIIIESNEVNLATRFDENWMEIGFPGYGEMCYTVADGVITDYNANCSNNVIIPSSINDETITAIGENAFAAKGLTSVTIPSEITEIGQGAFQNNQLTSITIPGSVTSIGDNAFAENSFENAKAITIEENGNNNQYRFTSRWSTIGFPGEGPELVDERPTATDASCFTFDSPSGTITDYDKTCGGTEVVIPSEIDGVPVTNIGASAFKSKTLKSVYIPYTVETIGGGTSTTGAFAANASMQTVTFENSTLHPSHLTTISDYAFYGAKSSKSTGELNIPASVTTIGNYAFQNQKFTSIVIENTASKPSQLTSIGNYAFASTYASVPGELTGALNIPASVTTIGSNAFQYQKFTSIVIENTASKPSHLTKIGNSAFKNNLLTSLVIPASVKSIGGVNSTNGAFLGNLFVESSDITIEYNEINPVYRFTSNWTYIGFPGEGPKRPLDESCFIFNESTGTITSYASDCPKDVIIPSTIGGVTVTTIGNLAFNGKKLNSVTIPYTVTTIESSTNGTYYGAFINNSSLTSVTFEDTQEHPSQLTTIGSYAFYGLPLTTVTIPSSVTTIGDYAFNGNQLSSLTISDSVTSIGLRAFYNNQLTSVTIPASVTTIGDSAFYGNQFSTIDDVIIQSNSVNLPDRFNSNWTKIGFPEPVFGCYTISISDRGKITDYAADGDECSYDVVVPSHLGVNAVRTFTNNAFKSKNITSISFPYTLTSIPSGTSSGKGPFSGNSELASITIEDTQQHPSQLTTIGDYAFYNLDLNILIPSSVTTIGDYAFYSNELTSVTIPASVTTIGDSAFSWNQLTSVTFENTENNRSHLTTIGEAAFNNNQLTSVTIPASVTTIGRSAFMQNQLLSLTLENTESHRSNLISIGSGAFVRMQLTDVTIPASVQIIKGIDDCYGELYCSLDGAFANNVIETVTFENTESHRSQLTTIEQASFASNLLTTLTIPASVTSIGLTEYDASSAKGAFDNNQLTSVMFEDTQTHSSNLITIGTNSFYRNRLSSVAIPNSVTTIGRGAFSNNQLTGTTVIPPSVITIGDYAYSDSNLTTIVIKRADSTGMTLGNSWNDNKTVVYDPNYAE